jgi:hypothetical protein
MIFIVKCVTITRFSLLMQRFKGKAWFLLFCQPLKLYLILYSTGTVFLLFYRLLRIRLKRQNPLLSCVQEREKVHCKRTMQCTVHFIITLFNVGNVLLCVIYQLNVTVYIYIYICYTYITLSVLSAVSRNRGRAWNVLTANTWVRLY